MKMAEQTFESLAFYKDYLTYLVTQELFIDCLSQESLKSCLVVQAVLVPTGQDWIH